MRTISIVCPCFNEQEALPKFLQTIENLQTDFAELGLNLEVIVVDDDSRDGSRELLRKAFLEADYLRVLLNPINMGVYRSTYRGLRLCTGDLVVPMFPIDLQDSPDVLIAMVKHKITSNKTAVMGQKKQRKEPFVLRSLRNIFYYLLQTCSRRPINRNMGEFGVVDFWVIREILRKKDHYPFIRSMISSITSDIYLFEYVWQERSAGKSNFSFFDLYDHAMNAFVSNGLSLFRPMVLFGFFLGFLGFIFAIFIRSFSN